MENSSCGPCSDQGSQMIENIAKELGVDTQITIKDELELRRFVKLL